MGDYKIIQEGAGLSDLFDLVFDLIKICDLINEMPLGKTMGFLTW